MTTNKKSIIFQILEWTEQSIKYPTKFSDYSSWKEFYKDDNYKEPYDVHIFGRTQKNKTISVKITGYKPYFYFEIPENFLLKLQTQTPTPLQIQSLDEINNLKIQTLMAHIKTNIDLKHGEKIMYGYHGYEIVEHKKFYGFTAGKKFKFVKLSFLNIYTYAKFVKYLEETEMDREDLFDVPTKLVLYESKIKPFIRCMHQCNITSCGWVQLNNYKKLKKDKSLTCKINLKTDWQNIIKYDCTNVQKYIIASFDIECDSLSGGFPNFGGIDEKTGEFIEGDPVIQIGTVFSYCGESEPFYKNIITLKKCELNKDLEGTDVKCCEHEQDVLLEWTKLICKKNPDVIIGYNIDGFDFEYMFKRAQKFNVSSSFLKLAKNTNMLCEYSEKELKSSAMGQNILKTLTIPGRIIIDLMKYLQKSPTINLDNYKLDYVTAYFIREEINIGKGDVSNLTYYNINDINENINDTCIHTKNINNIAPGHEIYLTFITDGFENMYETKYKITKICDEVNTDSSDEKIYKFYVNKIIPFELLKTHSDLRWKRSIQYNYEDNIDKKIKSSIILTSSIYGIYENQCVNMLYNDGLTDNVHDEKYTIEKIISEPILFKNNGKDIKIYQIIVTGNIPNNLFENNNEVFWCNAKDNITPNQIFKYQKGTDAERSKIAKYCVMDCIVVTKLAEKLKVITAAIGMANVCHVPSSYIFGRGQSVKIFSLVAKECRDENTLIPTLYCKKQDDDDDEEEKDEGYEGATVLTPTKGVHYEPTVVLDFRSLYPRSMKMGNVSHETYITDVKYLNLPDYSYYTISFKNNDGTKSKCTYAKNKNGELGIIPKILTKLLDEREVYKTLCKKAEDEFTKSVLDGLEKAYKVTANSLYGQIGAPVSSIYLKELAASTTAIGRKMLQYAKKFVETIFVHLINRSRHDYNSYIKYAHELFKDCDDNRFILKKKDTNGTILSIYSNKEEFFEYFKNKVHKLITIKQKVSPKAIYGDTDSIFFSMKIHDIETKHIMIDKEGLRLSIEFGKLAGETICKLLPEFQELAYEKTMWPLILIAKKMYVGNLYEDSIFSYFLKCM